MNRKYYWDGDTLLDPLSHPVGTRLILSRKSDPVEPYEATIIEWAPSGHRVRLQYAPEREAWVECWHYNPVVIEILEQGQ